MKAQTNVALESQKARVRVLEKQVTLTVKILFLNLKRSKNSAIGQLHAKNMKNCILGFKNESFCR